MSKKFDSQNTKKIAIKATYFSIVGNTCLAIIKGLAGYFGNSYALIADAIESTSDIFASALVLFGIKYSTRPADENHPYGHGRAEPLITFVIVVFLIVSAVIIAYKSIQNIGTPHKIPETFTLYILGAIIVWKEFSYRVVNKRSKETHSSSLKADAWHHRSDAITSVAAFVGISIAILTGYESADDWAALLASGFILFNAYLIFRPALGEIMDENRYDHLIVEIREVSSKVPGIIYTEKCLIRKAGMKYHVDLHAVVNSEISVKDGHDLAHILQKTLQEEIPELQNVLIHIEPDEYEEDY